MNKNSLSRFYEEQKLIEELVESFLYIAIAVEMLKYSCLDD